MFGGHAIKEANDDAWLRDRAKAEGRDVYYSATGWRDVETNRRVEIGLDGYKKFIK